MKPLLLLLGAAAVLALFVSLFALRMASPPLAPTPVPSVVMPYQAPRFQGRIIQNLLLDAGEEGAITCHTGRLFVVHFEGSSQVEAECRETP